MVSMDADTVRIRLSNPTTLGVLGIGRVQGSLLKVGRAIPTNKGLCMVKGQCIELGESWNTKSDSL